MEKPVRAIRIQSTIPACFLERHNLSLSTFYANRQQLQCAGQSQTGGFIKAEVVKQTTRYRMDQTPVANMTLFINDVELSIPQVTPASYLAE
ncbi:IS66 family insertion sequence element accessory protein TnpB [Vibrio diazotrophicus]